MANKIKFGISSVYYALKTSSGYDTPVALPGAVSLALSPEGERTNFAADNNNDYYATNANNGYSGSLELAYLDDTARQALLGEILDSTSKNLYEQESGAEAPVFALGFKVEGDDEPIYFWFYHVTASRPQVNAQTKAENIEPGTDTLDIVCGKDEDGYVRVKSTPASTTTSWFSSVVAHP